MKKVLVLFAMPVAVVSLAYSHQRRVAGTIRGSDGNPEPFAAIQIKGTHSGTTTSDTFQLMNGLSGKTAGGSSVLF